MRTKCRGENGLSTHVGGVRGKCTSAKKHSSGSKYINTLITSAMEKDLKIKKSLKLRLQMTPTQTPSLNILTLKI